MFIFVLVIKRVKIDLNEICFNVILINSLVFIVVNFLLSIIFYKIYNIDSWKKSVYYLVNNLYDIYYLLNFLL